MAKKKCDEESLQCVDGIKTETLEHYFWNYGIGALNFPKASNKCQQDLFPYKAHIFDNFDFTEPQMEFLSSKLSRIGIDESFVGLRYDQTLLEYKSMDGRAVNATDLDKLWADGEPEL